MQRLYLSPAGQNIHSYFENAHLFEGVGHGMYVIKF